MSKVIDASSVDLEHSRIVLDANVWILIEGFAEGARHKTEIYSGAYSKLLRRGNSIVVNDYILGEFCNRCCKLEYETAKSADSALLDD